MRFHTVWGDCPQFVKAAPLSLALRQRGEETIVQAGQHPVDRLRSAPNVRH